MTEDKADALFCKLKISCDVPSTMSAASEIVRMIAPIAAAEPAG